MEDSVLQQHLNMDEQLKLKNKEQIAQYKKDRKKKELDEYYDKNRTDLITSMVKILKKN